MDRAQFAAATGVSRETLERLDIYAAELARWNRAINLVAPRTLDAVWQRHFLDSWQVLAVAGRADGPWIDLGSGGGFPGLVLAACGAAPITLIESDQRKCVFLRETARKMAVPVTVLARRINDVPPAAARFVSARALAPLPKLLEMAYRFNGPDTRYLFLKGQDVESELTDATKYWKFDVSQHPSRSDLGRDSRGSVLSIGALRRHDTDAAD
ncbi:16S rRNA (guanine(527)-N(7))-methyltransferase RsmG [Minwuia sp.]|uniref:16S rRNA (guanine(527)-N(7))-methyltransferase RsmG n=1 Tax=Minwuia sp. TaxID=2493630 RepID=UPI003A93DB1F